MIVARFLVFLIALAAACTPKPESGSEFPYIIGEVIYQDDFDAADTTAWIVEAEREFPLADHVHDGVLDTDVAGGITIWNKRKFSGNVMFEFEVTVVQQGGPNDRVSDLNCFWMASDPAHPEDLFFNASARRGIFYAYYALNLYYVGYGGHHNTKTRLRKYNGISEPIPPVLQEHTDASHLIVPNKKNTIRLVNIDSTVAYFFNGEKLFELHDNQPYRSGYFGFRTVDSHLIIDRFSVYPLRSVR